MPTAAPTAQPADARSDEALMNAYRHGDAHAFAVLYDRHASAAWRFILRSVHADRAIADDLSQELWLGLARAPERYQPQPNARFRTWLLTLARNRVIDYYRSHKHLSRQETLDDTDSAGNGPFSELAADSRLGPLRQLETHQQAHALLHAIEQLPAEQREAFLLQAEGGMSVEAIAAATGASFETAKSRLRYARNKLKALLSDLAPQLERRP